MNSYPFSINCKADSIVNTLSTAKGRSDAIKCFKKLKVQKVYVESYRTGIFVEEQVLKEIKKDFQAAGFEVSGCIVATRMSKRNASGWIAETCFSDESAHELMKKVIERTASVFDLIIFDDFLFTNCTCEYCQKLKGARSWQEYRQDILAKFIKESIIDPARKVNKNIKLVIKYPCWYDAYYNAGYELGKTRELFDMCWDGTETRDPNKTFVPQGKAFWVQNWFNNLGNCGGGWYDPLECPPDIFVEQGRNTILGGAKESILHCYDYLFLGNISLAKDGGGLGVPKDQKDAEAFIAEADGQAKLANIIKACQPYGFSAVKTINFDPEADKELHGYLSYWGIPFKADNSINTDEPVFITAHCMAIPEIEKTLSELSEKHTPFIITRYTIDLMNKKGMKVPDSIISAYKKSSGTETEFIPIDANSYILKYGKYKELFKTAMPDDIRNSLIKNYGIKLFAPAKVSMLLFKGINKKLTVLQNFSDNDLQIKIIFEKTEDMKKKSLLSLPSANSVNLQAGENAGEYIISMSAHSLLVLE